MKLWNSAFKFSCTVRRRRAMLHPAPQSFHQPNRNELGTGCPNRARDVARCGVSIPSQTYNRHNHRFASELCCVQSNPDWPAIGRVERDVAEREFEIMPPAPAEIDRRPLTDDYRSDGAGTVRQSAVDDDPPHRLDMRNHYEVAMNTGTNINLRKLQEQLDRQPLDEIAMLVQALTYGEMIELAEGMWKVQPEGSAVTQENLPALLHRWSKSRSLPADEIRQDPGAV